MKDRNSKYFFIREAKQILRQKYTFLGIKDEELLKKLIECDALYFTFMYLHRNTFNENFQKILDEISDDF